MADLRTVKRTGERLCVACRSKGSCSYGISVLVFDDAAGVMRTTTSCPAEHEGGPGVAHGGWICAVFDELLGQHATERHGALVTATITVDFKRPVSVGEELVGLSWIEPAEGRKVRGRGELRLKANDALLASATGLFILTDAQHHARHAEWMRSQKEGAG